MGSAETRLGPVIIRRIDLRGAAGSVDYRAAVPRAELDVEAAAQLVRPVVDAVRTRGVEAIVEYTEQFDGVLLDDIAVPPEALTRALDQLDPAVRARAGGVDPPAAGDLPGRARGTT